MPTVEAVQVFGIGLVIGTMTGFVGTLWVLFKISEEYDADQELKRKLKASVEGEDEK